MHSLLIVIISITLLALFLYAGTSYVNTDNYLIKSYKMTVEGTITNLASQFIAYENLKGYPLQETDWANEIFKINRYVPKSLDNTAWEFKNNGSEVYFCLTGNVNENQLKAFKDVETSLIGSAYVNTNCGSLTSASYTGTFPVEASITIWIRN